jgi:hypothetical protein
VHTAGDRVGMPTHSCVGNLIWFRLALDFSISLVGKGRWCGAPARRHLGAAAEVEEGERGEAAHCSQPLVRHPRASTEVERRERTDVAHCSEPLVRNACPVGIRP